MNWIKVNNVNEIPTNKLVMVYMPPKESETFKKNENTYAKGTFVETASGNFGILDGIKHYNLNPITHYAIIETPKL